MSFLADLEKLVRTNHILVILGAIVIVYAVYNYSEQKYVPMDSSLLEGNQNGRASVGFSQQAPPVATGGSSGYAVVDCTTGHAGVPAGGLNLPVANPSDLLPRDTNNQWGSLNPAGSGDLTSQNLLSATFLTGIDTIGNTMKNANLQLRSEPPNPQLNVGPWNQSTFAPDLMRTPLEIGCGGQ
jgi:hypothetical protein